jgi:hypothetical protein
MKGTPKTLFEIYLFKLTSLLFSKTNNDVRFLPIVLENFFSLKKFWQVKKIDNEL